jgi:phosphate-selective porin
LSTPNAARIGGFSRGGAAWFTPTAAGTAAKGDPTYNQGGLEAAWGRDRLGVNSEIFIGSFGGGRDLYGGYVEARYFLTKGGTRLYDKRNGALGNVKINKNFLTVEEAVQTCFHGLQDGFGIDSWGAWEAFAQWSFTDSDRVANAGGVHSGGRTTDLVLGLNWYWSPTIRMMFEYVHSDATMQRRGGSDAYTQNDSYRATADMFATSLRMSF